jgi:hypothetical protein
MALSAIGQWDVIAVFTFNLSVVKQLIEWGGQVCANQGPKIGSNSTRRNATSNSQIPTANPQPPRGRP